MKKLLLFLFYILLFTGSIHAQNRKNFRQFGAGIYAGPQLFGKVYNYDKFAGISGFTGGLDFRYSLSKQPRGFSMHLQPGYNTFRHFTSEGANTQIYLETTWKWAAFHIPLLLRYTFSSGKIRPFAEIGPTLRLRRKLTMHNMGYSCGFAGCSGRDFNTNLQSETTKDPIILTAAAGVEIDIWKVTIPISVRLQEGISTFEMKEMRADAAYYDRLKTSTIQITAGVSF